jgi:16S rRNA (uracil1498-N3)-methyltransferase
MRRMVAHVFVEDLARPVLEERDVHHFSRVLRLRAGEAVSASDGLGGTQVCQWAGSALLSPVGEVEYEARPAPLLTVAFSLTKGDHPEWAVQKLTEAGVDRIIVMTTERSVVRWAPATAARQLQRLREVARQAAMQSRRAWLPVVEGPVAFSAVVGGAGAELAAGAGPAAARAELAAGAELALAVPGAGPLTLAAPTVLIGPEGGWTDAELAAVAHHVGLGPHVLRAETAALAAGLLLSALRAGLVAPAPPSAPVSDEN